jgi:hypothetical protein
MHVPALLTMAETSPPLSTVRAWCHRWPSDMQVEVYCMAGRLGCSAVVPLCHNACRWARNAAERPDRKQKEARDAAERPGSSKRRGVYYSSCMHPSNMNHLCMFSFITRRVLFPIRGYFQCNLLQVIPCLSIVLSSTPSVYKYKMF